MDSLLHRLWTCMSILVAKQSLGSTRDDRALSQNIVFVNGYETTTAMLAKSHADLSDQHLLSL
jgi:hypothetical protein